jgi:hypothetical protein
MEETFSFWLCLWQSCYSVQPGLGRGVNSENSVEGDGFDGNSVSGEIREGSEGCDGGVGGEYGGGSEKGKDGQDGKGGEGGILVCQYGII